MARLRGVWFILLVGLVLAGCGSKRAVTPPPPVVTEVPTSTPTVMSNVERGALEAVQAYAEKLGRVESIGTLHVNVDQGTALVEVVFPNNVRQIFAATLESGGWNIVSGSEAAG